MHALIIEDQVLIASMIEKELRDLGFTTFDIASSEKEAVAAAARRCPVLITADDRLTSGSGVEAVKTICADQRIPIIYIVGNPLGLKAALPHTVVLGKPFTLSDLREAVQLAATLITVAHARNT